LEPRVSTPDPVPAPAQDQRHGTPEKIRHKALSADEVRLLLFGDEKEPSSIQMMLG